MAILRDDEFVVAKTTGKPKITNAYWKPPKVGQKPPVISIDPNKYNVPAHNAFDNAKNNNNKPSGGSSSSSSKSVKDYTDYNAELLRQYNQRNGSYGTQEGQLNESFNNKNRQLDDSFKSRTGQLDESYQFALSQLQNQEKEQGEGATRLGQQAYISRMQAQRLNPNILSAQGLSNTGYKNISGQKIETQYNRQYEGVLSNYNQALNQIRESRQGQTINYSQNRKSTELDYNQNKQNTQLDFNQNKQSIELSRKQAYEDYLASLKK